MQQLADHVPFCPALQELLEALTFASECGSLISPPCWKTGGFCTGKLAEPYTPALQVTLSPTTSSGPATVCRRSAVSGTHLLVRRGFLHGGPSGITLVLGG